ncbi:MAG: amino acid-binding protein [Candidatus Helarchaeota archaeon]
MWEKVEKFFSRTPKKLKVIRTILELGCCIKDDKKIYCGPFEIPYSKIAAPLNVDRRVVINTVELVLKNPELKPIFSKIKPAGPSFREIAKEFNFGVIEIHADPEVVGIIAHVSTLIAKEGVSIRQILADDPTLFPDPKLTIITEKFLEIDVRKFLEIDGVNSVQIF